jgi:hypothetical protein
VRNLLFPAHHHSPCHPEARALCGQKDPCSRRKSRCRRQFSLSEAGSVPSRKTPDPRSVQTGKGTTSSRADSAPNGAPRLQPLRAAFASKNESGREPLELEQGRTHSSVRVANVGTAVPGCPAAQKYRAAAPSFRTGSVAFVMPNRLNRLVIPNRAQAR